MRHTAYRIVNIRTESFSILFTLIWALCPSCRAAAAYTHTHTHIYNTSREPNWWEFKKNVCIYIIKQQININRNEHCTRHAHTNSWQRLLIYGYFYILMSMSWNFRSKRNLMHLIRPYWNNKQQIKRNQKRTFHRAHRHRHNILYTMTNKSGRTQHKDTVHTCKYETEN